MFTLRKFFGSGGEANFILGNSYTITHQHDPGFEDELKKFDRGSTDQPLVGSLPVYAFVYGENGKSHALYTSDRSYIMCSDGKTYSNETLDGGPVKS